MLKENLNAFENHRAEGGNLRLKSEDDGKLCEMKLWIFKRSREKSRFGKVKLINK